MAQNNKLDEFFRKGLNDMEAAPTAHSWNAVSEQLNKGKILWWSFNIGEIIS